jgi:hypothetical protein
LQYCAFVQFARICPVWRDGANEAGESGYGTRRPRLAEVDDLEVNDQEAPEAPQEGGDADRRHHGCAAGIQLTPGDVRAVCARTSVLPGRQTTQPAAAILGRLAGV